MAPNKRSPYLSQMAYNVRSQSSSLTSASGAQAGRTDFFDLRRPDGNIMDWSIRSEQVGPRRSTTNQTTTRQTIDLSARSESYVPIRDGARQRRASERIYVNSSRQLNSPKRRSFSRMSPLHSLPESPAIMLDRPKMRQRTSAPALNLSPSQMREIHTAASQVNENCIPQQQRPALNKNTSSRRSNILMNPGPLNEVLNDHSVKSDGLRYPPFDRNGDLQNSRVSNTSDTRRNNSGRPRKSRSFDNLTEMAVQPRRESVQRSIDGPEGILLEIQQPTEQQPINANPLRRSTIIGQPKSEIPTQIDAMKMLKRHSCMPSENRYLEKPLNNSLKYSPTISTYQSSADNERKHASEIKVMAPNEFHSNDAMKISDRKLSDDAVVLNAKTRRRCAPCCFQKRVVIVGLFLLLAGMSVGGYFVFTYWPMGSGNEEAGTTEVAKESGRNASQSNSTSVNAPTIQPPPADIEGRCSVSNLPGSLSACLAACLPSACCYSGYTGDTCFEDSGCASYKPYCDIFYNSWDKSTEGVLRNVTDEMLAMCTDSRHGGSQTETELTGSSTAVNELSKQSLVRKRLRGHHALTKVKDNQNKEPRYLLESSTEQTCQDYCTAAKCCDADIIENPDTSGLVLSPFGVYTDKSTGEYAMTNCQASNRENVEICVRYQELCSSDEHSSTVSTPSNSTQDGVDLASGLSESTNSSILLLLNESSVPEAINQTILAGQNVSYADNTNWTEGFNGTLSDTAVPSQSIEPTSSLSPTSHTQSPSASPIILPSFNNPSIVVPSADAQSIQKSCATEKAKFLIRTGDASARAECIQSCLEGLCCFTDDLGYNLMDSCYIGNEHKCSQYAPCLILKDGSLYDDADTGNNSTIADESNITSLADATFYNNTVNITNINNTIPSFNQSSAGNEN